MPRTKAFKSRGGTGRKKKADASTEPVKRSKKGENKSKKEEDVQEEHASKEVKDAGSPAESTTAEAPAHTTTHTTHSHEAELHSTYLEKGHIYFFYRPKVMVEEVEDISDVQRLYIILRPLPHGGIASKQPKGEADETATEESKTSRHQPLNRLIVITKKKLPEPEKHAIYWSFVEKVAEDAKELTKGLHEETYETATRGERHLAAARPAGEGVYAIAEHKGHTVLAYVLQLPHEPGTVQHAFNIEKEGVILISVKNPELPSPAYAGLQDQKARFPEHLQTKFGGRRFMPVNPPEFLDYQHAELLLIGVHEHVSEELGDDSKELQKMVKEKVSFSQFFKDLHTDRAGFEPDPLLKGEWK